MSGRAIAKQQRMRWPESHRTYLEHRAELLPVDALLRLVHGSNGIAGFLLGGLHLPAMRLALFLLLGIARARERLEGRAPLGAQQQVLAARLPHPTARAAHDAMRVRGAPARGSWKTGTHLALGLVGLLERLDQLVAVGFELC